MQSFPSRETEPEVAASPIAVLPFLPLLCSLTVRGRVYGQHSSQRDWKPFTWPRNEDCTQPRPPTTAPRSPHAPTTPAMVVEPQADQLPPAVCARPGHQRTCPVEDALHTLGGLAMGCKLRLAGISVTFRNTVVKITVKLQFMGLSGDPGKREAGSSTRLSSFRDWTVFLGHFSPLLFISLFFCVHGEGRWFYRNIET